MRLAYLKFLVVLFLLLAPVSHSAAQPPAAPADGADKPIAVVGRERSLLIALADIRAREAWAVLHGKDPKKIGNMLFARKPDGVSYVCVTEWQGDHYNVNLTRVLAIASSPESLGMINMKLTPEGDVIGNVHFENIPNP